MLLRGADITTRLGKIDAEIAFIEKTVAKVEARREAFPAIDDAELAARKGAISALQSRVRDMRSVVTSKRTQGKIDSDRKKVCTVLPLRGLLCSATAMPARGRRVFIASGLSHPRCLYCAAAPYARGGAETRGPLSNRIC